jgi:hypothetical protein
MAQISRPFQIALVALGLLVAVWFLALHGHSTSTSGSGSAPAAATPAPSAKAQAEKAAASSPEYHGSVPGLSGLTRAIDKAHGAVATSQQNAKQLEEKAAQASSGTAGAATGGTAATGKPAPRTASAPALHTSPTTVHKGATTVHTGASTVHTGASTVHTGASTVRTGATTVHKLATTVHNGSSAKGRPHLPGVQGPQRAVEAELKQGKIVLLLFWNPKGAEDAAVRNEVRALAAHGKKIAVHEALASQVATFGSITRGVQVEQTPTVLIINKRDRATALTGLTDAFSLEQAIAEARRS